MKFNSHSFAKVFSPVSFVFLFVITACSDNTSSDPGRTISSTPTSTTGTTTTSGTSSSTSSVASSSSSTGTIEVTTGSSSSAAPVSGTSSSSNILLSQYPGVIPTTKVCRNVLGSPNIATLEAFFNWNIQNLAGPVTVCIEQDSNPPICPSGATYCAVQVDHDVRFRIEYEDDFRFWYYDSADPGNYQKIVQYQGGGGASTVQIILQDGAGFLMVSGNLNASTGNYDMSFSFVNRPSYSAALSYDQANGLGQDSPGHHAATLWDMSVCATSAAGNALYSDASNCAADFVLHYTFFTDMNTAYPQTDVTDNNLWLLNQATVAEQLLNDQFPTQFASFGGWVGGIFGTVSLSDL